MTKQKSHLQQVDYIRAIASTAVALFHLGGKALPILNYGWLGVQMFFLLSGFIICWAIPVNYTLSMCGTFISKRITRIEPPYILSIGLSICAHFIFDANYKPDWANIFFHIGYLNSFFNQPYLNPVYWTLGIEFQFYLLVALLFPLIVKKWGFILVLILCLPSMWSFIPELGLINAFPFFGLGIVYYLYRKDIINFRTVLGCGITIATCCIIRSGWLQTAAALFALMILILPLRSTRLINFLSKISFSLYLTHDIVGSNIVYYLGTLLPKTFIFKGIEFVTGIAITTAFAYIFFLLVEAPFLRLSKKIHYGKPTLVTE